MNTQIILADDHPAFRSGLKNIIEKEKGLQVIGEAQDGREIVDLVNQNQPDLIVMDINMPLMDGIEATREIKKRHPSLDVLILTMYTDEAYLQEGLAAGASGYVLKSAVDTELINAIRIVLRGETYIYPTLIPYLYKKKKTDKNAKEDHVDVFLSDRERDVLKYIALGFTQKEIAEFLLISIKTVDTYKARVMEKIGSKKRSDLVKFAIKKGLLNDT